MTVAYPLTWPDNIGRSKSRERGQFKTELNPALSNVRKSIELFGRDSGVPLSDVVLSSNVTLGDYRPADPGVAAWFRWDGQQVCIAVDRYDTVAANLQAIHHIVEARRTELRHGTLALVRASFRGFRALPAPKSPFEILGLTERATETEVAAAYRRLAAAAHPDRKGGSTGAMAEVNAARDAALKLIGENT